MTPKDESAHGAAVARTETRSADPPSSAPSVFAKPLPKGGGAIRGMGEKATHDLVTGAARFSLPIYTPPSRGGAEPKLSLSYDAGSGNGPFGLGFQLDLLSITRRTDRGVPVYDDTLDTFLLGGEELVPEGDATRDRVRYRPRREGAFAWIERIRDKDGTSSWLVVDRNNTRTTLGATNETRETDPDAPHRIYSWLVERVEDDHGNLTLFSYKPEDDANVPREPFEEARRVSRLYPKRIHYGNRTAEGDTCFEIVFDYGEHGALDVANETADESTWPARMEARDWSYRADSFSTYRGSFDRRTRRLCRRVLVFHHFESEPALVRSTELDHDRSGDFALLVAARHVGFGEGERRTLPSVSISYTPVEHGSTQVVAASDAQGMPAGVDRRRFSWVDLDGGGLAGALSLEHGALLYQRNEGNGSFAPPVRLEGVPSVARSPLHIADLDGSGRTRIVSLDAAHPGSSVRERGTWGHFQPLESVPVAVFDPLAQMIDIAGDGLPDLLTIRDQAIEWYPSLAARGFDAPVRVHVPSDDDHGPALAFANANHSLHFADMSGDGLADIVCIRNGEVFYWPNLGRGRFGTKVKMANAPVFARPEAFDPRRIRLADLAGTGLTDIVYLGAEQISYWTNQSGNRFGETRIVSGAPATEDPVDIAIFDLLGEGTACLVWSSPLPDQPPLRYLRLFDKGKPHLLASISNGLGLTTIYEHVPSTHFYVEDARAGRPWVTSLPFVVHVVSKVIVEDAIARTRMVSTFAYHHGYFDALEREFRGFALVESRDAEAVRPDEDGARHLPPVLTRSWFHTGAFLDRELLTRALVREYHVDAGAAPIRENVIAPGTASLSTDDERDALRALRGSPLRKEIFSTAPHPLAVTEWAYEARPLALRAGDRPGVWLCHEVESREHHYEESPNDPRTTRSLTLHVDELGAVRDTVAISEPRRVPEAEEQAARTMIYTHVDVVHRDERDSRHLGVPIHTEAFHAIGFEGVVDADLFAAFSAAKRFELETEGADTRRLERIQESYVLYCDDAQSDSPLPLGEIATRPIPYRTYSLALTETLRERAYGPDATIADVGKACALVGPDTEGRWFAPGPRVVVDPDQFFLPVEERDAFERGSKAKYDDAKLFVTELRDALENLTSFSIDYRALVPWSITDPNGQREELAFDALGRVTKIAHVGRDGEGDTLDEPTKRFDYDELRWERDRQPASARTFERADYRQPNFHEAVVYTDGSGREAMQKRRVEPETGSSAPRWATTARTIFDNKGNPLERAEPYFADSDAYEAEPPSTAVVEKLTYDPLSRVVRTDRADGAFSRVRFTPWTTETWDENDTVLESAWYARESASTDPALARAAKITEVHAETPTRQFLDAVGRVFRTSVQKERGGAELHSTVTLDVLGRARVVNDPRGCTTQQLFDYAGKTIWRLSPDAGVTKDLHDARGEVVMHVSGKGDVLRPTFDPLRRPVDLWITEAGTTTPTLVERRLYGEALEAANAKARNALGRVATTYDEAGAVSVGYDFRGRVVSQTRAFTNAPNGTQTWEALSAATTGPQHEEAAASSLGESFTTTTTHDAMDRVVTLTHPDGTTVANTFDAAGLLKSVVGFVTEITYDAKGRRSSITYASGVTTTHHYDDKTLRLKATESVGPSGTLQRDAYTYDPVGNIVSLRDKPLYDVPSVREERLFTYDALYRLLTATGREHTSKAGIPTGRDDGWVRPNPNDLTKLCDYEESYSYDDGGNLYRLEHTSHLTTNVKWIRELPVGAASNKLVSATATGEANAPVIYDDAGNVESMVGVGLLDWDSRDRLHKVDLAGGGEAFYAYDAAGQRVRKIVRRGGLELTTFYLGGFEVYRESEAAGPRDSLYERQSVHVMDGGRRIAHLARKTIEDGRGLTESPVQRFVLEDHLESVRVETDGGGIVIALEEYYPYGGSAIRAEDAVAGRSLRRYRFNGKERDEESGLYYFGARYYAPWWGRWISTDPVPRTSSAFIAMGDNPIRLVDPDGRAPHVFEEIALEVQKLYGIADRQARALLPGAEQWRIGKQAHTHMSIATPHLASEMRLSLTGRHTVDLQFFDFPFAAELKASAEARRDPQFMAHLAAAKKQGLTYAEITPNQIEFLGALPKLTKPQSVAAQATLQALRLLTGSPDPTKPLLSAARQAQLAAAAAKFRRGLGWLGEAATHRYTQRFLIAPLIVSSFFDGYRTAEGNGAYKFGIGATNAAVAASAMWVDNWLIAGSLAKADVGMAAMIFTNGLTQGATDDFLSVVRQFDQEAQDRHLPSIRYYEPMRLNMNPTMRSQ